MLVYQEYTDKIGGLCLLMVILQDFIRNFKRRLQQLLLQYDK